MKTFLDLAVLMALVMSSAAYAQTVQTVDVKVGDPKSEIKLAPGLTIYFGQGGLPFAVPDLILGDNYVLNDPAARNYVPINGKVSAYGNGQLFTVENIKCNNKAFSDGDVSGTTTTDCVLRITTESSQEPKVSPAYFRKSVSIPTGPQPHPGYVVMSQGGVNLNQDPLVYVDLPRFFLQKYDSTGAVIGGATEVSGGVDYPLPFLVVTSYGVFEMDFQPQEFYNGISKTLQSGPLHITIIPKAKVETQPDERFDTHSITVTVESDDSTAHPTGVVITDYQER